jgi:repressor LexA
MAEREKRSEIFDFLVQYIDSHGYGPSVREICDAVDLRSTATVHYHLRQLAEQGMIRIGDGKKRAISLVKSQQEHLPSSEGPASIPILGTVAAGQPILALEQIDGYLPWPGGADWFALRVKGESMKNAGILSGDLVIVRPQKTAENGEIVVALLEDEATVKRFSKKNGHIYLLPENEAFSPIPGDEAVILGLVRGVVRTYD